MELATLAALAGVGVVAGFVDSIAGGGGLATLPALRLAGFDPVATVATNKLAGVFGSGSATFAFWRAKRISFARMGPSAALALAGSIAGALALPYAPQGLLVGAMPFLLIGVALYFALAPSLSGAGAGPPRRLSMAAACALVGFYDGVFGPGAGSFYMIAILRLGRFELIDALAGARLANFASNFGAFVVYALADQIDVPAGLSIGVGNWVGAQIGARTALKSGAKVIRPLVVVMACALAIKLLTLPDAPWRAWFIVGH